MRANIETKRDIPSMALLHTAPRSVSLNHEAIERHGGRDSDVLLRPQAAAVDADLKATLLLQLLRMLFLPVLQVRLGCILRGVEGAEIVVAAG